MLLEGENQPMQLHCERCGFACPYTILEHTLHQMWLAFVSRDQSKLGHSFLVIQQHPRRSSRAQVSAALQFLLVCSRIRHYAQFMAQLADCFLLPMFLDRIGE